MKIGPIDIRNHTFTKKMRGVDEHEVHEYLDLVADRLEEAILEGEELRGRIDRLETEVRDHRALERSLRDSMLSAERLVDDRSAQAEKEAQIVIKNAEVQAGKILLQSREELGRLKAEADDLRRQKITYVERFRALLRSQTKILEASLETFDPDGAPFPLAAAPAERAERAETAEPPASPSGTAVGYVTRPPVPSPVPSPGPARPAPPQSREDPTLADPLARAASPPEPTGASKENFAPYAGQEGFFGGKDD